MEYGPDDDRTFAGKHEPGDREYTNRIQNTGTWDLGNMQPRRSIHSLPEPGSWERENMPEENFHSNGKRVGAVEHGSDHYMGRTY